MAKANSIISQANQIG